jgi:pimeloyl-ACP methyl ester carboxylesterase
MLAADIIAALWPQRCKALVSVSGYAVGTPTSAPLPPELERRWWYQFYFATEQGKAGYDKNRHDFSKLIWRLASPEWNFDDATFNRSAAAFNNPDHLDIVIHYYRWRQGLVKGEAKYDDLEARLALQPTIAVPTIVMEGDANGAPQYPDDTLYRKKSQANIRSGSSRAASGTTCLRKLRTPLPKPFVAVDEI